MELRICAVQSALTEGLGGAQRMLVISTGSL